MTIVSIVYKSFDVCKLAKGPLDANNSINIYYNHNLI